MEVHVKKRKMEKNKEQYAMVILLCLLLLFTGVQALQINSLKETVSSSDGVLASQQRAAVPAVRSAPAMVGGC
jgi:hypothetical protein